MATIHELEVIAPPASRFRTAVLESLKNHEPLVLVLLGIQEVPTPREERIEMEISNLNIQYDGGWIILGASAEGWSLVVREGYESASPQITATIVR